MEGDFPHDLSPSQLFLGNDDTNNVPFNDGNGTEPSVMPTQEDVLESEDEGADEDEEDDSKLKPVELEMKKKAGWVWIPVARLRRMSKKQLRAHHREFQNMQLAPGQEEVLKWQRKRVKDRVGGQVKRERDREARRMCEEFEMKIQRLCTEVERLSAEVEMLKALVQFSSEL